MRRMLLLFPLVLAVTAVAAFGADNTLGTWKVNMAKSKYSPGPMPLKSYTAVRESAPGGVKVTITGERTDGTAINASYTAKYDGTPVAVSGSGTPYDTIALKQVDANTVDAVGTRKGSKYNVTFKNVVAKDGKSMTTSGKGTDENGASVNLTLVYDKQ